MSGIPDNKTFRSSIAPGELYSYIRAKLDLSGQLANNNVLYFNAENLLAYQNTHVFAYPNPNSYPKYHKIDQNVLIGEVVASSSPDMVYAGGEEGELRISSADLIAVSRAGGNATLILDGTAASFGLATGDYIAVSGLSNAGFNTVAPQPIVSVTGAVSKASGIAMVAVARNGSNVATLSLSNNASFFGLAAGNYISISGIGNAGFNTSVPVPILAVNPASVVVSGAQVTNVERASGTATLTLNASAASYGFALGDFILVSGITNDSNSFNITYPVALSGVSGSTISYPNAAGTATVATTPVTGSPSVSYPPNLTYANTGALASIAAATGTSKDVSFPPRLTYANAGGVVSETAASGSSRQVITPILLHIGGAYKPSSGSPSIDLWAGPTGNEPAVLSMAQLEHAQVCYYGSEPADPDSDPVLGKRKFLAVKLTGGNSSNKITRGVVSVLIKLYPKFW